MTQKPDLKCVGGTALKPEPKAQAAAAKHVAMPAVLQKVRNHALEELYQLLGAMFYQADDVFFEYSSKASNEGDQNACLDAMRNLRIQRKTIEQQFIREVARGFARLPDPRFNGENRLAKVGDLDTLSLVDNDELEQHVAVDTMVAKARDKNTEALYQLTMRLDALMLHTTVDKSNNPLDPKQLSEAFKKASKEVQCPIKFQIIFFKLFDKFVLEYLDRVLGNTNCRLAKAGILPDLKGTPTQIRKANGRAEPKAAPARKASSNRKSNSVAADVEAANEFFGQLQSLLASVREFSGAMHGLGGPIGSTAPGAQSVEQSELISMLSKFQQAQPKTSPVANGEVAARVDVRHFLENRLKQQEIKTGPARINDVDTDLINLVSMLFDFILDDENLPDRVKALLGRLQIPYLKVAVLDKSFFNRRGHPARKLLNELARAGIGLADDAEYLKKDLVFAQLKTLVQTVLDEFDQDMSFFEKLHEDFSRFMQQEGRRAALVEQRTKAAEVGKAKSELAKKAVSAALAEKVQQVSVPPVVTKILDGLWTNYLFLIYLKQGENSQGWKNALATVDYLIDSVTPPVDEVAKKRIYNIVPIVAKNLRQAGKTTSFNPFELNEMLTDLESVQIQIMRDEMPARTQQDPAPKEATDELLEAVGRDLKNMSVESGEAAKIAPVTRLDVNNAVEKPVKPVLPVLSEDDEHWVRAKAMQVGCWMEYSDEEGIKTRCKLAAFIRSVDKMIFVNRSGIKIHEKCTLEFAHDLKAAKVVVLDDSMLFDRALENVIGNLKKIRQKSL